MQMTALRFVLAALPAVAASGTLDTSVASFPTSADTDACFAEDSSCGVALLQVRAAKLQGDAAEVIASNDKNALLAAKATAPDLSDFIDWSICDIDVHSNLGGLGPDSGEDGIRYKAISTTNDGEVLDLIVTNLTEYSANSVTANGRYVCFGLVNVLTDTDVTLKFQFVKSGTNELATVGSYMFSVYDVDQNDKKEVKESVTFNSALEGFWLTEDTELKVSGISGQALTFTSSMHGTGQDNPTDPVTLDPPEEARTVTTLQRGLSEFTLKFAAVIPKGNTAQAGGRNFLFAGKSDLSDDGEFEDCDAQACEVWADPHVSGFDNAAEGPIEFLRSSNKQPVDVNAYEEGDFWLVRNELVHIQGRFRESKDYGENRSAVRGIAVGGPFIPDGKLIVQGKSGDVTWNGQVLAENSDFRADTAAGAVKVSLYYDAPHEEGEAPSGVSIRLPLGVALEVRRFDHHIDAKIMLPRRLASGTDGQCGNFNGDPQDDTQELIKARMGDLRVADSEVLFKF